MTDTTDYDDLCKRLRDYGGAWLAPVGRTHPVCDEAADAIAALREQVAAKDAEIARINRTLYTGVGQRLIDAEAENAALHEQVAAQSNAADMIAEERDAWEKRAKQLEADNAAIRELMNVYNLGGWTDAIAPMQRALAAEADNAALRAQVEAFRREQIARSKIDPVTRLHNLCDHLAEQRRESPFTAESLELADASYKELCAENAALRKAIEAADDIREQIAPAFLDDPASVRKYDTARAALLAGKEKA